MKRRHTVSLSTETLLTLQRISPDLSEAIEELAREKLAPSDALRAQTLDAATASPGRSAAKPK